MRARFFVRWTIRKEGEPTRNPGSVQTFLPLDAAAQASAASTASQEIFPGKSWQTLVSPEKTGLCVSKTSKRLRGRELYFL
jgi:hypothetical protein